MNAKRFEPVREQLHQALARGAFPGVCAAAGRGDDLLFVFAQGRLSSFRRARVNEHTRFDMASVTKLMATTMLAMLAFQRGVLSPDTPVSAVLDAPADKRDITVKHLLTHTSGLPASFLLEEVCGDPAQAVGAILSSPLVSPVGGAPVYSCMGFIVLGEILQRVFHASLDALSRTLVFEPLGMPDTGYLPRGGNIAATEVVDGRTLTGVVHDENARFLRGAAGNAGVFSTTGDCARFASMLARGGAPLLTEQQFRAMISDHTPAHAQRRGLGVLLRHGEDTFMGTRFPPGSFGHTGFTGTSIAVDPATGLYGVLLTNAVHPKRGMIDMTSIRRSFYDLVYDCALA